MTVEIPVEERQDCVVRDEHGLFHTAIICDRHRPEVFLVAMCDFLENIDKAVVMTAVLPERRWPIAQEVRGVTTCLRCLGL